MREPEGPLLDRPGLWTPFFDYVELQKWEAERSVES